ncbi:unnamed protein product [Symbiodinium necroappetens]|uniref:Reverse transcriptase domain-containing protein n=1 Tax=Symbiodinium necroappetens TaxID=1628268 RepID=A0A812Z0K2_9DINO|nr:unnamed protein product [Symbiodinium necroappetens]
MDLGNELQDFFQTCRSHVQNARATRLHSRVILIQRAVWTNLRDKMWTLLGSFHSQSNRHVPWMISLQDGLRVATRAVTWVLDTVVPHSPESATDSVPEPVLRLGLANPGVQGCSDIAGSRVRWDPLINEEWGLKSAVSALALDAVGLSAPRLPDAVVAPRRLGMHIFSKGGRSYASTAVLRSERVMFTSTVRSDVGSDRRIWVDFQLGNDSVLHWVILTMPTSANDRDSDWVAELQGDMNVQPDELGGGREPSRKRQVAWEKSLGPAGPAFPGKWHDATKWAAALRPAEPVLQSLSSIAHLAADELCLPTCSLASRKKHVWGIEAAAALTNTIGGLVRDVWLRAGPGTTSREMVARPNLAEAVLHELSDDTNSLIAQVSKETDCAALLNSCFKLLRDPVPQPLPRLHSGPRILSEAESNQEWVKALRSQCSWPEAFDEQLHLQTVARCQQLCAAALRQPSGDSKDFSVTEREVVDIRNAWSTSKGMPPDLLPRALFMANSVGWNSVVWALQRWTGPGGAAFRPSLWRQAALCPVHKAGPACLASSFRLIFVKVQLGLMQEALLTQRWLTATRRFIQPCQSGYIRGVDDAHLLLHEVSAEALHQHRPLWFVLGDFQKAFPRVCRHDLLCALADGPHVNGHCLGLLGDILKEDHVVVWYSGFSDTIITSGIPEGGCIGPFGYPVFLDSLVREILAEGGGLGVGWHIPPVWQGRVWSGHGNHNPALVSMLKGVLQHGDSALLPSIALLDDDPDLEASALQALNDSAPWRIAAILHADDPVLLGCSRGALQQSLNLLARWAFRHKAAFHVGEKKTVTMVTGKSAEELQATEPLVLPGLGIQPDRTLGFKSSHKWLGILWPANLEFDSALKVRVAIAQKSFALLVGLAQRDILPLHLICSIFWARVFASLSVGLWLNGTADSANEILDDLLVSWARQLLGASCWHNASLLLSELGWDISGHLLAVMAAAMRRARLWTLPTEDLYAQVFRLAHAWPNSWASRSSAFLSKFGILDFPAWNQGGNLQQYRLYVRQRCRDLGLPSWREVAQRHARLPLYLEVQPQHSNLLHLVPNLVLGWEDRQAVRSFCRLRAGIIRLTHVDGRLSRASIQNCIFCSKRVRTGLPHVLCRCATFEGWWQQLATLRRQEDRELVSEEAKAILACPPSSSLFVLVLRFAKDIDVRARLFWNGDGP